MANAPLLFRQLADITSMRDIELMEFGLLKTLNGFLMSNGLSILKTDTKECPCTQIIFNNAQCVVNVENIIIGDDVKSVVSELLVSGNSNRTIKAGDGLLAIYHIHKTRALNVFLIIATNGPLSRMNSYLIDGMLQIYRNFCDLLREGQTDQLTGLYNRKTFDESINKVFGLIPIEENEYPEDRRKEKQAGYWLAMADIDHFKTINDKFGHVFGDEVLVLLAQMMVSTFREKDMLFRFGGEEFVFILHCSDRSSCHTALERFRVAVENRRFPQIGKVTISIGACRMSRTSYSVIQLDYADKALYHSKHNGRNQLTFFEDLLARGLVKEEGFEPGDITLF